MPYKRVLLIGFLIGLFSGIITAIYLFIKFTYMVDISAITEVEVLKRLEETSAGLSPEELEETRAMALKFSRIFSQPIIMAPLSILNSIFGMFVLSLIVGLGVRKEFNKYE
jgi:ABC-type antimicrobial peptide transport system permease subunit